MGRIDGDKARVTIGSEVSDAPPSGRWKRIAIGDAVDLSQFGVNILELQPGAWSADRHWHSDEDEFVHVLEGEVVLVAEGGETILRAGDSAGFKAGVPDGHHLQNRSATLARVLEVGSRRPDSDIVTYPDLRRRKGPRGMEGLG